MTVVRVAVLQLDQHRPLLRGAEQRERKLCGERESREWVSVKRGREAQREAKFAPYHDGFKI